MSPLPRSSSASPKLKRQALRGGRFVRRVRCRCGAGTEPGAEFGAEFGPYLASCCATYLAQVGASDVVKELYALGEEAFAKETDRKASTWWNQKGSGAARMKEKWLEDNKKRPASAPSDEPAPRTALLRWSVPPRPLPRQGSQLRTSGRSEHVTCELHTHQSCSACPHPTPEQAATRRHATTAMHANHAPRELRLMEQLRAHYISTHLRMSAQVWLPTVPHRRCEMPCGLLWEFYGALRATCGALRSQILTSVRFLYGALTESGPYATYGALV